MAHDGEALGQLAPVPAADRPVALQQPPRDPRARAAAENAERDRVHPVGEVGPGRGDERAADDRPDRGRRPLDELEQRVRGRELARSATRFGSPASTAGRKNALPMPGERGEQRRSPPRSRERQRGEDAEPAEVGADHQRLAREPVDERPEQEAEEDGRQDVRDQQRADPPAGVRPVVDVDLERDDREPVADARSRTSRGREAGSGRSRAATSRERNRSHRHGSHPTGRSGPSRIGQHRTRGARRRGRRARRASRPRRGSRSARRTRAAAGRSRPRAAARSKSGAASSPSST